MNIGYISYNLRDKLIVSAFNTSACLLKWVLRCFLIKGLTDRFLAIRIKLLPEQKYTAKWLTWDWFKKVKKNWLIVCFITNCKLKKIMFFNIATVFWASLYLFDLAIFGIAMYWHRSFKKLIGTGNVYKIEKAKTNYSLLLVLGVICLSTALYLNFFIWFSRLKYRIIGITPCKAVRTPNALLNCSIEFCFKLKHGCR